MDLPEIISRLEKLEGDFLTGLQEIRSIKAAIQSQSNRNHTLEPLLEAEELAKILRVDVLYIYSQARAKKSLLSLGNTRPTMWGQT